MDAEWDEKKRAANLAKHGIDFHRAALIFAGPLVEYPQKKRDYGEDRIAAIGRTEDLILYVIYT